MSPVTYNKGEYQFLKDADYHYVTTNNNAFGWERAEFVHDSSAAQHFIHPVLMEGIKSGLFTEEQLAHALKCMGEVAGKASFGAFYAKEGLRSFLGVPREMGDEDTRILGDFIEMFLQCRFIPYEVEKFEAEESVYVIGREQFTVSTFLDTLIAYWYGASKTLLSAKFSLWEENSPEGTVRLKIARKIDKFC